MLESHRLDSGMELLVARPAGATPRPAVVMLHERYGILQHQRDLAERMASEGFVACLPDLFHRFDGDREALARGDARCDLRDADSLADLDETIAFLRSQAYVGEQVGIVGFCQSGREPLLYAGHRDDVSAVATLYGGVGKGDWESNDARPETIANIVPNIDCPVLGLFGERDHVVAVEEAMRFRDAMEAARRSYRIRVYHGAPHGWLNDTMPGRFKPRETEEAWAELTSFFRTAFTGAWPHDRVTWDFASAIAPDYDFTNNRRLE